MISSRFERAAGWRPAGITGVCLGLAFCGGTVTFVVQQYEGPPRSKENIAIIRAGGASATALVAVDGAPIRAYLERDNRLHVEVLPGEHDVDVAAPSIGLSRILSVRLLAGAGKVYRVEASASLASQPLSSGGDPAFRDEQWTVHAYEVDPDTDARRAIADAPVPTAAPAPVPAPSAGADAGGERDDGNVRAGEQASDGGLAGGG